MLSDQEKRVLSELLKNAKTSDRNIARMLKVSQATITRIRRKLENEGYIRKYTVIPDFGKLGCEIVAFTFVKMNPQVYSKNIEEIRSYANRWPNAIYASRGEGMGMTGIIISLHKNYTDYLQKLNIFRRDWGQYIEDIQSFITTVSEGIIKEFNLEYIAECLK
ncbi:MAG: winged helix-turn-helix transcriptional regulator [Candidatus Bathyarchaeia archaeon]